MPNLKELNIRIGGVKKTKQITSAMKLVAGAKLKRATERASAAQPYQEKLTETLSRVATRAGSEIEHPLLSPRETICKILVVVITSDRGLCGPFNNGLMRRVVDFREEQVAKDIQMDVLTYGRKSADFLKGRRLQYKSGKIELAKHDKLEMVRELAELALREFQDGAYDQVWIAYNHFVNTLVQRPTFEQVVPIRVPTVDADLGGGSVDYLYEPAPVELLGKLLPLYLRTQLLQAFLETEAGEHAARMTAMESATKNATEIIGNLTIQYNRARQAAITTEITEIVSGAEAL